MQSQHHSQQHEQVLNRNAEDLIDRPTSFLEKCSDIVSLSMSTDQQFLSVDMLLSNSQE